MLEKIDLGFLNLFDSETIDTYFVFAKKKDIPISFFSVSQRFHSVKVNNWNRAKIFQYKRSKKMLMAWCCFWETVSYTEEHVSSLLFVCFLFFWQGIWLIGLPYQKYDTCMNNALHMIRKTRSTALSFNRVPDKWASVFIFALLTPLFLSFHFDFVTRVRVRSFMTYSHIIYHQSRMKKIIIKVIAKVATKTTTTT